MSSIFFFSFYHPLRCLFCSFVSLLHLICTFSFAAIDVVVVQCFREELLAGINAVQEGVRERERRRGKKFQWEQKDWEPCGIWAHKMVSVELLCIGFHYFSLYCFLVQFLVGDCCVQAFYSLVHHVSIALFKFQVSSCYQAMARYCCCWCCYLRHRYRHRNCCYWRRVSL